MRRRNTVLALILIVIAVVYFIYDQSGYDFSEKEALRQTVTYSGQVPVYEQAYGSDKVVILSDGSRSKAQIVHRKWGFLYKPGTSVEMAALKGREAVRYAWFSAGSSSHDGKRDVVFAAETSDPAVKKIIISNDSLSSPADSAEVKKNASVYVELDVGKRYGIAIKALDEQTIGSFVIRAADADGKILAGS